jgi:ABC-type sulfate/molybdate transport systems ATPase subunit
MPFTLEVEPLPDGIRADVTRLAAEIGIDGSDVTRPVADLSPSLRLRVRLGRALALSPLVLLAEHPTASLPADDVPVFAADFSKIVAARGIASVMLTADRTFAASVADEVLTLQPATGELKSATGWRRWFAGR